MPLFRITIRHGRPQTYTMDDVHADTLADAFRIAADRMGAASSPDADLAEIRIQADPESRKYA